MSWNHRDYTNTSEILKKLIQNKTFIALALGLVIGIIIGLVYGYVINPVEWVDAPMDVARQDLQEDYLRMAIDSYKIYKNELLAITRWQELGGKANEILDTITYSPGDQGWEAVYEFAKVVTIRDASPVDIECETVTGTNNRLNIILWGSTTLLVIGIAVFYHFRAQPAAHGSGSKPLPIFKQREIDEPSWLGAPTSSYQANRRDNGLESEKARYLKNPPLENHIWTFVMGDDQFEETCSIDSKKGHFLGECGIEIAKTMENSNPKRPTAFDIWLFDKNEINTRSVILMSHNAYENDLLKAQFEMKGRPVLAEIGKEIDVSTDHLLLRIRVLDMICAQNEPGRCEYFQRLSLDVNIWQQKGDKRD